MLSDELSIDSPSEGFKIIKINSNQNSVNYWDMDGTALDWSMDTGVDTGPLGSEVVISFGDPGRFFMIWGISFHKEQFLERNPNGFSLKIAYSNYMDIENEAYNVGDYRNPTATENGKYTISINPSDLDEQGCFYFKELDGNPLIFVASAISLDLEKGKLNFDLIGTNVDFVGMAKGKMANNQKYNYYSDTIERFWIKGKHNIFSNMEHYSSSIDHKNIQRMAVALKLIQEMKVIQDTIAQEDVAPLMYIMPQEKQITTSFIANVLQKNQRQ